MLLSHVSQEVQLPAQTPLLQLVQPEQAAQGAPFLPHDGVEKPDRHVAPSQHPPHNAVQFTSWPQAFWTVPHLPAQTTSLDGGAQVTSWPQLFLKTPHLPAHVTSSGCGVQPQTPSWPLPPHVSPVPSQVSHTPPLMPQLASVSPSRQVVPSQHPSQLTPSQVHVPSWQSCPVAQVAQAVPPAPQAPALCPPLQTVPSQHPSQQPPPQQLLPAGQALPQEPQLSLSLAVSTQAPLQRTWFPGQEADWHAPPLQVWPKPQAAPSGCGLHLPLTHFWQIGHFGLHFFFFFFFATAVSGSATPSAARRPPTAARRLASDRVMASKRRSSIGPPR